MRSHRPAFLVAVLTAFLTASVAIAGEDLLKKKISVEFRGIALKAALAEIQEKTGIRFAYSEQRLARCAPVTLSVSERPAAGVLRRLLRPEGLELVQSREGLAALVELASDAGACKAMGRALRTGVRLLVKLDGACQEGGEIRIPGWTGNDDRELAEATIDFFNVCIWLDGLRTRSEDEVRVVERLAVSFDPDVRAGAAVLAINSRGDWWPIVDRLAADPDPVARGCWLALAPAMFRGQLKSGLAERVRRAAKDERVELRIAALIADATTVACGRRELLDDGAYSKDPSAAVRCTALVARMTKCCVWQADLAALNRSIVDASRESNPLFRAAMLAITLGFRLEMTSSQRNARQVDDVLRTLLTGSEVLSDPILGRAAALVSGALVDIPTAAASARIMALSDKGLERRLGCAALAVMIPVRYLALIHDRTQRGVLRPLDLGALPEKTNDADLVLRLTAIFACGGQVGAAAQARLIAALKGDESSRHAALLACMMRKELLKEPLPAELRDAVLKTSGQPGPSEAMILGELLTEANPEDMEWAAAQIRKDPGSALSKAITRNVFSFTNHGKDEPKVLLDAILASGDSQLVGLFLRRGSYVLDRNPQLAVRLIRESPAEAVPSLIEAWSISQRKETSVAFSLRLRELAASKAPSDRLAALRGLIAWAEIGGGDDDRDKAVHALAQEVLDPALKAGGDQAVAAMELLSALCPSPAGFRGEGKQLPDFIQVACVKALGLVEDPDCGNSAMLLLCQLIDGRTRVTSLVPRRIVSRVIDYRLPMRKTLGSELVKAIDSAGRKVRERGGPENRVQLYQAMADAGDGTAVRELAGLCIAGKLPAELREEAVMATAYQAKLVPPEFGDWLLARAVDPEENSSLREGIFRVLGTSGYTGYRARLAAAVLAVFGRKDDPAASSTTLSVLCAAVQAEKKAGQAVPPWVAEAAALALKLIRDEKNDGRQSEALRLLAHAAPEQAAAEVETQVLSGKPEQRRSAAALLPTASPRTGVYAKLISGYDRLDKELCRALAESAAQSPHAPKADDFVIRALNDASLWRYNIINRIEAPATPKLLEALEAFTADKDAIMRQYVKLKLQEFARQGIKPPPIKRPDPPEVF